MKAKIDIIHPGTFASIQDGGRFSYAHFGVPQSGFIDKKAAQKINKLLDNKQNVSVLEWTQLGPKLRFTKPCQIAVSHTTSKTTLNGESIRARNIIQVPENSLLHLGNNPNVVYSYLAIKGGFKTERILGSRSMQKELTSTASLQSTSSLFYKSQEKNIAHFTRPNFEFHQTFKDTLARAIDCYKGPEYHLLDDTQQVALKQYFTLSNLRNRMGMQLTEQLPNMLPSMLSVPILPGSVQLSPSGKLIVLNKDCQTTGGYPRILHLPENALAKLSQTPQNVRFRFNVIDYN